MGKIIDLTTLAERSREMRAAGRRLVATNGCFDLLHVGHVRYLQKARALGDSLVVGLNGDASVHILKGAGRPIHNEGDRAEVLAALAAVDYVVVFSEERAVKFLEAAAPAIYVKGGDYTVDTLNPDERSVLQRAGTQIEIIPFEQGYSTSDTIKQMQKSSGK